MNFFVKSLVLWQSIEMIMDNMKLYNIRNNIRIPHDICKKICLGQSFSIHAIFEDNVSHYTIQSTLGNRLTSPALYDKNAYT